MAEPFDLGMTLSADGSQAVAEIAKVEAAQDGLAQSETKAAAAGEAHGNTLGNVAQKAKAQADALAAVTRATNPAVGSQKALDAALRSAEKAYLAGAISAKAFAQAQQIAAQATFKATTSAGQMRAGQAQLGMQLNDISTQLMMGARPAQVFAAQANQVAMALSLMGGTAGRVGTFLSGPWGAGIVIAGTIFGGFIEKLLTGEKQAKKTGEATELHKMSVEELTKAIQDNNKALERANQTGREAEQDALNRSEAIRRETADRVKNTISILNEAKALHQYQLQRATGPSQSSEMAALGLSRTQGRVDALEKQLAAAQADLVRAEAGVAGARVPLIRRIAEARTDPTKANDQRHEDAVAAATQAFYREARSTDARIKAAAGTRYAAALERAANARDAEAKRISDAEKAANKRPKKPREISLGDQIQTELGESILAQARKYEGLREGRDSSQLEGLFKSAGIRLDPDKLAWCAAFVNAVLNQKGLPGSGSLKASDFRNYGQETDKPQKGDIVVLRPQAPGASGHVGFYAGEGPGGRVKVVGGNQGRAGAVTETSFARSEVVSFRRVPTGGQAFDIEERQQKEADALADFGQRAGQTLGGLANRFSGEAPAVVQMRQELAALDALLAEIQEKQPPNLDELLKQASAARALIEDGVNKPFRDFVDQAKEAANIQSLINQGREDEAEAQRIILDLERQKGALLPEEREAVLAIVQARRAEAREAEIAREKQQRYLDTIGEMRDAVRGLFDLSGRGFRDFPGRLLRAFEQAWGDHLFDKLFGDAFRKMTDRANGTAIVEDASQKMATAIDRANAAIARLAQGADAAADKLAGREPAAEAEGAPEDIVVTGNRDRMPSNPTEMFEQLLTDMAEGLFGERFARAFGKVVATGLEGAMLGSVIGPLATKVLGVRGSKTGGAIGGAVGAIGGQALGTAIGGPLGGAIGKALGTVIGSTIGSAIGGAFKKAKFGSATVSDTTSSATIGGNNAGSKAQASTLGANVQRGLQGVAEALGATIQAFSVSIGVRDGKFRVDPTGRGNTKTKKGALDFGEDETAAYAAAIADAIADGALGNISAAVRRALGKYGADIDRGLQEALKVQALENLLRDAGGIFEKTFRDLEAQLSERVRIAKEYGFDLVALEKLNAKERADTFERALKDRVGALTDFLQEMDFGSMFEGTLADQRTKLQGELAKQVAAAQRGEEGAASQVASISRQLLETSREGYGTAGPEYAADRAAARAQAEQVIAAETARAREAQERATAHLNAANTQVQLQNEANNIAAQQLTALNQIANGMAGGGGGAYYSGGGSYGGGAKTSRNVSLNL